MGVVLHVLLSITNRGRKFMKSSVVEVIAWTIAITLAITLLASVIGFASNDYTLFLSNKGTYVKTSVSKNNTVSYQASFIPNSYFFFYEGYNQTVLNFI